MKRQRAADIDRPFSISGFEFGATGVVPVGRPSFEDFEGALGFAQRVHKSSGFWLADLLRYGDSRGDWSAKIDQAGDVTGLTEKTLYNIRAVAAIEPSRRRENVSFGHHAEVAGLAPKEQSYWLEQSETEGWSQRELRVNIRAARRRKVIEGQALLAGQYRVVYADPPWQYEGRHMSGAGAEDHYGGMTVEDICKLPVAAHVYQSAVLFLWVTAPLLYQNPGPREVMEAWGFTYKTGMVWDKVLSAGGHYVATKHEHLLIGTRGSCLPDRPVPSPDSVVTIRRPGEHSAKPREFRTIIEGLYDGPYLELFGREPVERWSVFGNDAKLWGQAEQGA